MMNVNEIYPLPIEKFSIEITNMCTLKCPACPRTRFIEQWPQNWKNHNLDPMVLSKFINIDLTGRTVQFCGNYGDPIYHPQFHEFLAEFKSRGANITINTNGSYKDESWWHTTCGYLDANDEIIFGIDGLPDTFTLYRINADWNSIKTAISVVADYPVKGKWQFIPFKFNEHQIDEAKKLSKTLGLDEFFILPSDRFDEETENLIPMVQEHIQDRYVAQSEFKKTGRYNGIKPQCANGRMHYVSADGFYSPCCYVSDVRFYYKTIFGKQKKLWDIRNSTFAELLGSQQMKDFTSSFADHSVCQFNCPMR